MGGHAAGHQLGTATRAGPQGDTVAVTAPPRSRGDTLGRNGVVAVEAISGRRDDVHVPGPGSGIPGGEGAVADRKALRQAGDVRDLGRLVPADAPVAAGRVAGAAGDILPA